MPFYWWLNTCLMTMDLVKLEEFKSCTIKQHLGYLWQIMLFPRVLPKYSPLDTYGQYVHKWRKISALHERPDVAFISPQGFEKYPGKYICMYMSKWWLYIVCSCVCVYMWVGELEFICMCTSSFLLSHALYTHTNSSSGSLLLSCPQQFQRSSCWQWKFGISGCL